MSFYNSIEGAASSSIEARAPGKHWRVVVTAGRDAHTVNVETQVTSGGGEVEGYGSTATTATHATTRTYAEVDALFELVRDKHPLFCFCLNAPLKHGVATDRAAAVRYAQAFLASVLAVPALADDVSHISPFFTSIFRYIPEPYQPASLQSRRSVSASAFSISSIVFSRKRDDIDVFFEQAKAHILAVYAVIKDVVKDVDAMAGVQIEYGAAIRKAELRLSEYSMDEIDAIAVPLRKLAKFLHTLESITNSQSQFHISNIRQRFHAHTRSLKCMKVALEARLVALDEYEDACKVTQRKTQALERMGGNISASGPSPGLRNAAEMSLAELQQAKDNEGLARERLFYATSAIKENYGKVRSAQGEDMQRVLNDYVSNQLQCNREVMEAIEAWV